MARTGIIRCVVLSAVAIIFALVAFKFARDFVKIFASLVWVSRFPSSHAVKSSKTAEQLCVNDWNFSWAPKHYSIMIDLDPGNQTFMGNVTIEGRMTESASLIELNCENLTIHRVYFDSVRVKEFFVEDEVLIVQLVEHLEAGSEFVVNIEYEGVFHESLGVIMKTFRKNSYMIATNLEPVSARRVFPCIDYPRYKATFDVAVKRPENGLQVLSNMPEKDPSDSESEWVFFQRTPKMSTYLVAFIVTDYVPYKVSGPRRHPSTKIQIWVPRDKVDSMAVKWAAALTSELLYHLQNFIGSNFTLPKLDLFSTPPFEENVGGMENWGLIVIREKSLMKKVRSTVSDEMEIIYTITHELAHDWFGNLVTIEDWCSVWIQEALSSYIQAIIPTKAFPPYVDMVNLEKWFARDFVLSEECQSTDLRSLNMDKRTNSSSLFDVTDYHKGAAVLFMLESVVTQPVFRAALRKFIEHNQYKYVTDADLWAAVQDSADANGVQLPSTVAEIMSSWVNQVGHPIVDVKRDENGTVTVSQTLCSLTVESSDFWLPVTYTTKSEMDFSATIPKTWLFGLDNETQLDLVLHPKDWIIVNIQNSGVYRVNYDSTTWSLLVHQLKRDHSAIHPVNRAILLDDAFHLASIGRISYSVPLRLIGYLGSETSAYVWEVVHSHVWKLTEDKLPREELQLLKKYIGTLLDSVYPKVADWEDYDRNLDLIEERKLRGLVYGLTNLVDYLPFRRDAVKFIEETAVSKMNNDTGFCECTPSEVSEHLLWTIALADGPPWIFELRVQHYNRAKDPEMKKEIIREILHSTSNVTNVLHWLRDVPVDDETWDYYLQVFQDSWPTKCQELSAYFGHNWLKLKEAYEEYRRFMVGYNEEVPKTPADREKLAHLMKRFLRYPPMTERMTATCYDMTKQVFNITQAQILADHEESEKQLRDAIDSDVVKWLRRHANKQT